MSEWIKACGTSSCIEVKFVHAPFGESWVIIRNSNDHTEYTNHTVEEWDAFVAGVKAGEFDRKVTP